MERQLQRLSWLKVKELVPGKIDTLIFPVGTVEAHGCTCIGTDNLIPEAIAAGIAERLNALVAPTVNYGITKSLYRYNGSVTVSPSTLELYVAEILDSFADTGFKNIILMNGHGGNNASLKEAAYRFHHARKANIAVIHWWQLCEEMTREFFGHQGGHAGTDETAFIQAIDPQLVDRSVYDPGMAYYYRPGADVYPVPGSILIYRDGEGYPNFDAEQAARYRAKVIEAVGDYVESVLKRWKQFGL